MLEKRAWVKEHCDHLRTALMLEPRGHADMYGALLTEPERAGLRRRRAVHAQRGLQHDVRPRRDRGRHDRARARADRAAARPDDVVLDSPAGPIHATRAGRPPTAHARVTRQLPQRAVVRAARRRAGAARRAARSAPTSPSAARSTRSSTARPPGSRSCPSGSTICAAPGWRSSTRVEAAVTVAASGRAAAGRASTARSSPARANVPGRRPAQRDDLRRRGGGPIAMRDRHMRRHGGARRQWACSAPEQHLHAREHHRHAVPRPDRARNLTSASCRPSCPSSKARPSSPGSHRFVIDPRRSAADTAFDSESLPALLFDNVRTGP